MIDTSKRVSSSWPDPPQQQPYTYGRRESGRWARVPWAGLTQTEIDNIASACDLNGLNYEVRTSFGGRSEIVIEYPYNFVGPFAPPATTESEDFWEIAPNKAMKDLLDSRNQLVLAMQGSAEGQQELTLLKAWKRQNTLETNLTDGKGNFAQPTIPPITGTGAGTPFSLFGTVLAKYIYDGVEQVEIAAPVLTHTKTVAAQYVNPAAFTNINRIISSATLISSEGVPSTVLFDFPTDTDPGPIPIGTTGFAQNLNYGWMKNSPSVRQVAYRKWNIVQTWNYGLWPIELYGIRL